MEKETTTATIYSSNRDTLERIKRKLGQKKLRDTLNSILKMVNKLKLEGEL